MAPTPGDPALFPTPCGGNGPSVQAMRASIEQWRLIGKLIGPSMERSLLDQAEALDLARTACRPTQISGANKVLVEMLDAYKLLGDAPPPADDPFTQLMRQLTDPDSSDARPAP